MELPGGRDAGWSQPLESGKIPRQFLLYGIRKRGAKYVYEVEGYDFANLSNVGERKMGKKGTAAELTYKPEPSGYFMAMVDGKYIPVIRHTWVGGDAWADLGAPVSQYIVSFGSATAGNATFSYGGVGPSSTVVYNPTAAALKTALVGLDDGYTASDWTVTGTAPTFTVTVPNPNKALTGDGSGLTGGSLSITPAP